MHTEISDFHVDEWGNVWFLHGPIRAYVKGFSSTGEFKLFNISTTWQQNQELPPMQQK